MGQPMLSHVCLLALSLFLGLTLRVQAPPDPNYVTNGDFENGLTGWSATGHVSVETESPLAGTKSLKIGPGKAVVSQRYEVPGLRIMEVGATCRLSSPETAVIVRVRCYDGRGRVVMDLRQGFDPKKALDSKGVGTGIYFKTQGNTSHVVFSIEKTSADAGIATVDSAEIHDYDKERQFHSPTCDLQAYMRPIWEGSEVTNESVLLLSTGGAPPRGRLLFHPTRVLSVRDSSLSTEYKEREDYRVEGTEIVALPGSKMTSVKDTDFPKGDYPWLSIAGKHVAVTYTHEDVWQGPTPVYEGSHLTETMAKLRGGKPVTVVALGDSITLGINVSGYRGEAPYMPTWPELATGKLAELYNNHRIKLYNTGLGGMTSQWGKDNARDAVATLNPDLVTIAFGMNDFWSITPAEFRSNIQSIISTVRAKRPKAEFILISSIRFDPAYTADPTYVGHLTGYQSELKSLAGEGICLLDLTALSEYLYKAKSAKDLLADPMHPDDFLARWFAQSLVAMLSPTRQTR